MRRDKPRRVGEEGAHNEGAANHVDLESCAGGGDIAGEGLTEAPRVFRSCCLLAQRLAVLTETPV